MPRGNTYGNVTTRILRNTQGHFGRLGPSESALAQFLYPFAFRDVVFWWDDFTQGRTTLTDDYTLGTDACSTAFAKNVGLGGRIQGVTQNTAVDYIGILTGADWFGDNNAGQEMRWQVDNQVTAKWHQGFHDPLGDNTLTAINDIDTPTITNCAVNLALIARDTSQTLTTTAFITDGCTCCFNATKTNLGTWIPTNSVYHVTRVQLATNAASAGVWDACNALQTSAQHGCVTANSVEGGTAMQASLIYGTLACVAKTVTADYWALWEDRRTS